MPEPRLLLLDWNTLEQEERVQRLRRAGYRVERRGPRGPADLRAFREDPPDAFLIDLERLPSQGRAIAVWLRQQKATRGVPLVFIEGNPEKTERVRKLLPDAVYASWARVPAAVRGALRHPPREPVVPGTMDDYAGTPLPKKLGIRPESVVALLGALDGFERKLGPLPGTVNLLRRARGTADVILLFVTSESDLRRRFPPAERMLADGGRLWILWPKKASGVRSDLGQPAVRAFGLKAGLVDYKVSAIDETWSGLCFARRRSG